MVHMVGIRRRDGNQLRIWATSSDSGRHLDWRCKVGEAMIAFIQQHFSDRLPATRTVSESDANESSFAKKSAAQ